MHLELFFGQATSAEARVYAEVSGCDLGGLSLRGVLRGPTSLYARTLQTDYVFRPIASGETLLAEAIVPDPCFWTPDTPFLYQATIEMRGGEARHAAIDRCIGVRPMGVRGKSLFLEGRRWVLRGVVSDAAQAEALPDWREASAALVTQRGDDETLSSASRVGVFVVARVDAVDAEAAIERLRVLSREAAVCIVVVPHDFQFTSGRRRIAPNVLLAQWFETREAVNPQPWTDVVFCEGEAAEIAGRTRECGLPVIACRRAEQDLPVHEARRECDKLQRALAPYADFAGYVV